MKKILIVLLAALLVLAAVACKAKEEPQEAAKEESMTDEPLAGGWIPAEDFSVTDERQAIFDKGMAVISSIHTPLA